LEFSFIVPTYNEEGYIKDCLNSLLNQNYSRAEFEIIVSDASSTDQTIAIANTIADRVVVDERKGISYGRNMGAKNALGDILVFIDADVILKDDFLKYIHMSFDNLEIIGITGVARPLDGGIFSKFVYRSTYLLVRLFNLFETSLFPGICIAYRHENFISVNGFREDFGIVEDLDLSKRISEHGSCRVNGHAIAYVSTRRLKKHGLSTVLFHIFCDIRYLLTGYAPPFYPKEEELNSWQDLWKNTSNR
jgi:glycosyltransferase involved in cell wall biosynthesis